MQKGPYSLTFLAGLLVLGGATLSAILSLYRSWRARVTDAYHERDNIKVSPLSSGDEAAISAMAPLLLAAETAARVDETAGMTSEDLNELELNLRMLLSGMDSQLEEIRENLQPLLPDNIQKELLTISGQMYEDSEGSLDDDSLVWREFSLLSNYCSDDIKRTYRSLLFNKSVQSKLLKQVENQLSTREESTAAEEMQIDEMSPESVPSKLDHQIPDGMRMAVAGAMIPHVAKQESGGEDAFFVSAAHQAFGIADGVGGWATYGIDPAEYSRGMMRACAAAAESKHSANEILEDAFANTQQEGSCTIAVAKLEDGILEIISVGDCSARHLRHGKIIGKTEIQEHSWNQPYQLSNPEFNRADKPEDAQRYLFEIQDGDVVVMGSDGFWDNVWDYEVEEAIAAGENMRRSWDGKLGWEAEATEIAQRLLSLAEEHSVDTQFASPFADEKQRMKYPSFLQSFLPAGLGGKMDDITVVVALFFSNKNSLYDE